MGLRVARGAFLARASLFGIRYTVVAEEAGRVVGLVIRFPGRHWPVLRVRTGFALLRSAGVRHGLALVARGWRLDRAMPAVAKDVLFVSALAVTPGDRGRGVGTALLRRVVREAEHGGYRAAALDVDASNGPAVSLYRREGFVARSKSGSSVVRMEAATRSRGDSHVDPIDRS